jgi:hypothetical protein
MTRTKPMARTSLRVTRDVDQLTVKPKRTSKRKCCICHAAPPANQMATVCSVSCAIVKANQDRDKRAAKAAKVERAMTRQQKQDTKPIKEHLKATEKAVNLYARVRDHAHGCISCDKPASWDGVWHASHFKSVDSNSVLRFNLLNIHKACDQCNWFMAGNIAEYEKRLLLKIGAARVDWLKCQGGVKTYDAAYLVRLKAVITKKTKRALKRIAA